MAIITPIFLDDKRIPEVYRESPPGAVYIRRHPQFYTIIKSPGHIETLHQEIVSKRDNISLDVVAHASIREALIPTYEGDDLQQSTKLEAKIGKLFDGRIDVYQKADTGPTRIGGGRIWCSLGLGNFGIPNVGDLRKLILRTDGEPIERLQAILRGYECQMQAEKERQRYREDSIRTHAEEAGERRR